MSATTCLVRSLDRRTHCEQHQRHLAWSRQVLASSELLLNTSDCRTRASEQPDRFRERQGVRRSASVEPLPYSVPVCGVARNIRVKFASTRPEWEEALRLVEATYEDHGYEPAGAGCFRFTSYHVLPDTVILVAKDRQRVVATMSLYRDNTLLGLPAEKIYAAEIARLRCAGRRLSEVGNLAGAGLSTQEFFQVLLTMFKVALQHHLYFGGDSAVITSTPRHGVFYRKVLGFVPLGPCQPYAYVQDTLAQGYYLDVPLLKKNIFQKVLGETLAPEVLLPPRMPAHLVRYFGSRSSRVTASRIGALLDSLEQHGNPRRW